MNLYFLDKECNQHLVAENVEEQDVSQKVIADLAVRYPKFVSYYQRTWWDEYFRYWIDYGSHTEFYILQKPEQALNVIDDTKKSCSEDYCELELD